MKTQRRTVAALVAGLVGIVAGAGAAAVAGAGRPDRLTRLEGTIWVANRGAHTIRRLRRRHGRRGETVAMAPGSQPGDLAVPGKLYVAEEFGTPPAIAIVDPGTGDVSKRIELEAGRRARTTST